MDLVERQRIGRIERQLAHLYDHLGLDPAAAGPAPVPPEVYELARSGQQARAVKAYCEATGVDLAAGSAYVRSLAAG
jgi:hypothetical protein